jgi:hypothetical protein
VIGRGYHTLEEHVDVASLLPRTRLLAGLMMGVVPRSAASRPARS